MRKAGIMIMAGTDTGDPYTYPGFDLHRELLEMVNAGLSPLEALRSATLEPARYLDADDALGTVERGHLADLVLLDADPLADIRNTQKISAVFVAGKYLPKVQLNLMLASMRRKK
jgi:imidazolonepropionase-like amidohydrolase